MSGEIAGHRPQKLLKQSRRRRVVDTPYPQVRSSIAADSRGRTVKAVRGTDWGRPYRAGQRVRPKRGNASA